MKRIILIVILLFTIFHLPNCRQIKEFSTLLKCDFRISTLENITLGGINVQKIASFSDLTLADGAKLLANISSGSLPLSFTLNVEVRNPNQQTAALNKLDWIALIDDTEIAQGTTSKRVEIPPKNGIGVLPIQIHSDLVKILSGQSGKNIINFGLNLVDAGNRPTRVSLKAKPTIMIGNQAISYPGYITIKKDFGSN